VSTVGGNLHYYGLSNGAIDTTRDYGVSSATTIGTYQLNQGQFPFAVEEAAVSSGNPTITVKDGNFNFSASATFTDQTGAPAQVVFTQPYHVATVGANTPETFTVQLEDKFGNKLTTTGRNEKWTTP
jgi:hypothetical protein